MPIDANVSVDSWGVEWKCPCGQANSDSVWDFSEDLICGKCKKVYRFSDDSDVPEDEEVSIKLLSEDEEDEVE